MTRRVSSLAILALAISASAASAQSTRRDAAALASAGAAALDERRFGDALNAFTSAAGILPRDPSVCVGAGVAAFMLGQNDVAQQWFERALQLNPRALSASEWLGELHYRAGRVRDAIAVYERALTHAAADRSPAAKKIEGRLSDWRRETALEDRFYESRGAHFVVRFEGPADEALARRVVERLEAAYWRIGQALGSYPPEPITVVLYTSEQFRDITQLPAWTAAAYDGRIRLPIQGAFEHLEELDRVLGHEYVHALVATLGGRTVPVWLNEGLATVLERGGAEEAEQLLARTKARPRLQQLHGSFFRLGADDAAVAYAISARAVERLTRLAGAQALVILLRDLAQGEAFATAFHQRIAMRYDEFQAMVARD